MFGIEVFLLVQQAVTCTSTLKVMLLKILLYFGSTLPTSTQFTVGEFSNSDGESYVAYLFAHDDHRFGDYADKDIIKCGKATMPASGDWHDVDLGWEPQWILIKPDTNTTNWQIFDSRRGIVTRNCSRSWR